MTQFWYCILRACSSFWFVFRYFGQRILNRTLGIKVFTFTLWWMTASDFQNPIISILLVRTLMRWLLVALNIYNRLIPSWLCIYILISWYHYVFITLDLFYRGLWSGYDYVFFWYIFNCLKSFLELPIYLFYFLFNVFNPFIDSVLHSFDFLLTLAL